jgi:hypothetical protein
MLIHPLTAVSVSVAPPSSPCPMLTQPLTEMILASECVNRNLALNKNGDVRMMVQFLSDLDSCARARQGSSTLRDRALDADCALE